MQGPPEDAAAPVAPDAEAGEAVVVTEIVTSGDAAEPVIEASETAGPNPGETVDAAEPDGEGEASVADAAAAPEGEAVEAEAEGKDGEKKMQKRKVALFLAYIGSEYQGMQRNPGCTTIEGVVHEALVASGGIIPENASDFSKVGWNRAARTDKGVSAVGQVVSMKLCYDTEEAALQKLNEKLPLAIVAVGFRRVTAGFDARKQCDRRRYEYLLPAFAFDSSQGREGADSGAGPDAAPPPPGHPEGQSDAGPEGAVPPPQQEQQQESVPAQNVDFPEGQSPAEPGPSSAGRGSGSGDEIDSGSCNANGTGSSFVFDAGCLERLNDILAQFKGTHNFHNYTIKVAAGDAQAKRYILSCAADEPITILGKQWVRIVLVGQSFMMHQIRKMVGMAVAEFRGEAPPGSLKLALSPQRTVEVPMAPALGLLLVECCYDAYNDRWAGDGSRPRLQLSDWSDTVNRFKEERLYKHIGQAEEEQRITREWVRGLTERSYHFSRWATARRVEASRPKAAGNAKYSAAQRVVQHNLAPGKRKASEAAGGTSKKAAVVQHNDEWSD
mmetsp:Transcript_7541/g.22295  ORF Transcript_7541/g.22295 Transcript_7541/m.22295 type:complete len:555 (-) Transcript_7541:1169-2833(-)